jgi:hypothetical protein
MWNYVDDLKILILNFSAILSEMVTLASNELHKIMTKNSDEQYEEMGRLSWTTVNKKFRLIPIRGL